MTLQKREFTQDVYFKQCSVRQVFFWKGHSYQKLTGNRGLKMSTDAGEVVTGGTGIEVVFNDDEIVIISNDDVHNLRHGS